MARGRGGKDVPTPSRSASRLPAPRPSPTNVGNRSRSPARNLPKPVSSNTSRSRSHQPPQAFLSPGPSLRPGGARQDGIRMIKAGGATAETPRGVKPGRSNKVSPKTLAMLDLDETQDVQPQSSVFGNPKPKKHEAKFRGPVKQRKCTDVFCLVMFLLFIAGWAYMCYFAFTNGVLERILYPVDTQGQICGYKAAQTRPYLFYFDLTRCMGPEVIIAGCLLTKSMCVSHCPNEPFSIFQLSPANPANAQNQFAQMFSGSMPRINTTKMICLPDIDKSAIRTYEEAQLLVATGQCASYYLPSGGVLGRCLPGFENDPTTGKTLTAFDKINDTINVDWNETVAFKDVFSASTWIKIYVETKNVFINIGHDYTNTWRSILGGFGLSALLALAWVVLIRFVAGPLFLLSFLASVGGLIYGAYYCYWKYVQQAELAAQDRTSLANDANFNPKDFNAYMANPATWMTLGWICVGVLAAILLLAIFLRKRIRTAVAMIRVSSRAISHMLSTLFFPLLPLVMQLVVIGACGSTAMWLTATGRATGRVFNSTDDMDNQRDNDTCDPNAFSDLYPNATGQCRFEKFHQEPYTFFFQVYNAFGFLWAIAFCSALGQMTLAGAFASYYWAWLKPEDLPWFPLLASLYRCFRYHIGSLALGSFLIATVQLALYSLLKLQRKLRRVENRCTKCLIKICLCCLACLENMIKYINRHAYVQMAIMGENFFTSAKNAFSLLVRNALRVIIVDSTVSFFLFFGKLIILALTVAFFYYYYNYQIPLLELTVPPFHYIWVPLVTICIGSYVITSMFFSVYTMAIDTMFLCFLDDLEKNDGTVEKPYFMSKSLMAVYGKSNAAPTATTEEDEDYETKHDVQEFASRVLTSENSKEQFSNTDLRQLSEKANSSKKK